MKVLVTGGAGYIGSTVASGLLDAGHTPIIIDNLSSGCRDFITGRVFYEGDIADEELLNRIYNEHPDISCCMHFAARIIVPESVEQPYLYYNENVTKSIALFHSLQKMNIRNVIYSGSAAVYKETNDFVVNEDEDSHVKPLSPYARTKYITEMVLEDFCNADYFRGISLRYFNPIGAEEKMRTGPYVPEPTHIIGKLVKVASGAESSFNICGTDWPTRDGTAIRDYIHISDLANAHVLAAEKFESLFADKSEKYHVINIGSGNGVTVKEFTEAFMRVHGKKLPVINAPRRAGDVVGAYANCDKAYSLLGWQAKHNIEDGIRAMLQWTNSERFRELRMEK